MGRSGNTSVFLTSTTITLTEGTELVSGQTGTIQLAQPIHHAHEEICNIMDVANSLSLGLESGIADSDDIVTSDTGHPASVTLSEFHLPVSFIPSARPRRAGSEPLSGPRSLRRHGAPRMPG